jgi:hypothetical protein
MVSRSLWFARSLAALNPSGLFMGVAYVAQVPMSMNDMKALFSSSNAEDRAQVQGADDIPWGTEKYVVLAPLRLHEGRHLRASWLTSLGDASVICIMDSATISYGHSAHTWR